MVKSQAHFGIDMVVQMPKTMFQEKDFTSMRYFYRRAYYIAYIAASVKKELEDSMDIGFEYLNENPLLPVLALRPKPEEDDEDNKGKPSKKKAKAAKSPYTIRLIPCAPEGLFPKTKLLPSSNNNRSGETDDKKTKSGTPFYNSTLKAEETFISYLRVLTHAKNECPALTDACALGRIWLQQRGFGSSVSQGGFGHFEWSVMIALLLQMGGRNGQAMLSNSLSSTELFKAAVQFLSTTDFNEKPFVFGSSKINTDTVKEAGPVMYDPIRELNVLYKMSPWSASLLQMHAKSTTDNLADEAADKFAPTFIIKSDAPLQTFDAIFEVKSQYVKPSDSPDRRGAAWDFSLEAHKVLAKAFGNRSHLVHFQLPSKAGWKLGSVPSSDAGKVQFGVMFEFAQMARQMEHGPAAEEQEEAAKFRRFWGEKAELRRFKDGSILECVEWSSKVPFQICEEIAEHTLKRHLKVESGAITAYGAGFSNIVTFTHMDKEAFDAARRAFQTLEYDIRNLEDLPLQIRQLAAVSPAARYASVDAPRPGFHTGTIEPIDVNLYFEASGRWAENLVAIQETKIEFLLDFDRRLKATKENITTHLGRENKEIGIENLAYLDIVYDTGAAFRLRIHSDNAHKLSSHISEELIELFVLSVFLQPYPWRAPTSASTGFLRVLTFLSRWDWRDEPLIVDSAEELTDDDRHNIRKELEGWRKKDPNMNHTVMFVATSVDTSGLAYTRNRPSKLIASRMTRLAKAACKVVKDSGYGIDAFELFETSLEDYDVLFHLSRKAIRSILREAACDPSAHRRSQFKNLDDRTGRAPLPIRAHPVDIFMQELQRIYEDTLVFFRGTNNGEEDDAVIGAIWNPKLQQQKFRAGLPYNFHKVAGEDDDVVVVNRKAVLAEISRIGGDMIRKIEEVE